MDGPRLDLCENHRSFLVFSVFDLCKAFRNRSDYIWMMHLLLVFSVDLLKLWEYVSENEQVSRQGGNRKTTRHTDASSKFNTLQRVLS